MADSRIIPLLDPTPTEYDEGLALRIIDEYERAFHESSLCGTEDEAERVREKGRETLKRLVSSYRVSNNRDSVEWAKECYAYGFNIDDTMTGHDLAISERGKPDGI